MKNTAPTTNPPSRKRTKVVIAVLILLCVLGLTWLRWPAPEPSYNGKPFTLWLEEYSQKNRSGTLTEEDRQDMKALGQMGPKAIPIILHTLEKNDSSMINKYRETWPRLPDWLKKALPKSKPEAFSVYDAQAAFRFLSAPDVVPQLPRLLRSSNPAVREVAAENLNRFGRKRLSLSDDEFLSLCISGLGDSSAFVRVYSAMAVTYLGPAASNAIPALIHSLQASQAGRRKNSTVYSRAGAASALGRIGPAAASSVPALTNLLSSSDAYTRVQIAAAVWHITSNENLSLPVLIADGADGQLQKWDAKQTAFKPLQEMGPRAKIAIPMLLSELTNPKNDGYTLGLITNALKSIDPEAAAKAGVK